MSITVIRAIDEKRRATYQNETADFVRYEAIDLLKLKIFPDDSFSVKKQKVDAIKYLRKNTVLINLIGVVEINEAIIKLILPGSDCRLIMFRCKKRPMPTLHQGWLDSLGFHRTHVGLKGYLEGKRAKVIYLISIIIKQHIISNSC